MIARLREVLDVARAMLREAMERNPMVGCPPGLDRSAGVAVIHRVRTQSEQHSVIVEAVQIGAISSETGAAPLDELVHSGLVPCPTCSTMQQPRDGHMAVHFARATDLRPCVGSWPARKAAA